MILAFVLPVSSSDPIYAFISYSVDYTVEIDGMTAVVEKIFVNFATSQHGIRRYIPESLPHWATAKLRISDIDCSAPFLTYSEAGDFIIRMGDPDVTVTGPQVYDLRYRMSPSAVRGRFSLNLIGSGWSEPVNNATLSITFPKEIDPKAFSFYAGAKGSQGVKPGCNGSVQGRTFSGSCDVLDQEAMTVTLDIDPFYFSCRLGQYIVFGVGLFFLVALIVRILTFYLAFRSSGAGFRKEGFHPAMMGELLYGSVNSQIELLYLASEGKATLNYQVPSVSVVSVTPVENGIGQEFTAKFRGTTTLTGASLDRILCHKDVSREAADLLMKDGYLTGKFIVVLWWLIAIIGAPLLALLELQHAYQTIGQPLIFALVVFLIAIAFKLRVSCSNGSYVLGIWRLRWFCGILIIVAGVLSMGLYWARPSAWDTIEMSVIGAFAMAVELWAYFRSTRWTNAGARVAAEVIEYRDEVLDNPPANDADDRSIFLYAAYLAALAGSARIPITNPRVLDWSTWAQSSIRDPDAPVSDGFWGGGGDWGGGDWGGGGGDFGGGGDCGGGGGGGDAW
jgi:uncharacterized membrane protein YgcG